jgi:hypothetical protein
MTAGDDTKQVIGHKPFPEPILDFSPYFHNIAFNWNFKLLAFAA